jgi:cell division transport system ATP-binding protein
MIRLDNVNKTYKNSVIALRDVSVNVNKGEFVFLVGASGSGKSTFIKLLIKDEEPDSGDIIVAGKRLRNLRAWRVPSLRRELGCVFQDFKLLPSKTVFENVSFALEVIGKPRALINRTVPEVLQLVGLGHKFEAYPHELSGGEQQRVSVARAFVNRPRILLCDEPTGNLDSKTGAEVISFFSELHEEGVTLIIVTHEQRVSTVATRIIGIEDGLLIEDQAQLAVVGAGPA